MLCLSNNKTVKRNQSCVLLWKSHKDATNMLLSFGRTKWFAQLVGHAVRGALEACPDGISIAHKE